MIHLEFPHWSIHAIGSEVAAETSSIAERNAPAKTVAVWRTEAMLNIGNPLDPFSNPTTGPVRLEEQGACQLEKV
jgi:hypothetical protein